MEKQRYKQEFRLIAIAIFSAFLLIFVHLILAKSFADMVWTEYTAAAIPFVMFGLCLFGIKYASKAEDSQ